MILCSIKTSFIASVFMLLMLTGKNTSHAISPPFNLTMSCHNFTVTAHWKYMEPSPGTQFKVKINRELENGDPNIINTTRHHCDVSSLITSVENSYYLEVNATNGTEESAAESSETFSFDKYMPSEVKCVLDFPAVKLSIKGGKIMVHFVHPLQLYKTASVLQHLEKTAPAEYNKHKKFVYYVVINDKSTFTYNCTENKCHAIIPITEKKEMYCVTLNGLLKNTVVRSSESICSHEEPESSYYRWHLLLFLVPLVLAVVIMTGIKMFKKVNKTTSNLKFEELKIFAFVLSNQRPECNIIQLESVSVQKVQSVEPRISVPEETHSGQLQTTVLPRNGRFKIGPGWMTGSAESANVHSLLEDCDRLSESSNCQSEMDACGYDRPHQLDVEMSPGDKVTGYGCFEM
ncbi:interferon gamma receptor 1 [Paramormyrops kingsleyae]|uniref:interferon gamma receptor 1 n=1 Tax=Paramormyrops kingsleyae TaxID=1676925 RepID=UPI003B973BEB